MVDTGLAIKAASDDFVGHDELVELLLQVIVLEGKQVCVVLQGVQFLLVAVTGLEETLIALSDGFQLTTQRLELVVALDVSALCTRNVVIKLARTATFGLLLAHKLPLSLGKELVALVSIVAVLLQRHGLVLTSSLLSTPNFKLGRCVLQLDCFVMQLVIQPADLLLKTVQFVRLLV